MALPISGGELSVGDILFSLHIRNVFAAGIGQYCRIIHHTDSQRFISTADLNVMLG